MAKNARIGYLEGLFDSIEKGFESLKDIEDFDPKYGRGIITRFEDYEGYFYRNFDSIDIFAASSNEYMKTVVSILKNLFRNKILSTK